MRWVTDNAAGEYAVAKWICTDYSAAIDRRKRLGIETRERSPMHVLFAPEITDLAH